MRIAMLFGGKVGRLNLNQLSKNGGKKSYEIEYVSSNIQLAQVKQ